MKKNIGNQFAFYPTPVIVVGALVDGKPDFTLVAHIGIVTHDAALVSLNKAHYINRGIKQNKVLSVNVVDESWLEKAAVAGGISGLIGSGATTEYHIIDGQQRLTTVTLLLLAIRNLIQQKKITTEEPQLDEQINERFLISKWAKEDDRIKLRPVKCQRIYS